MLYGKDSRVSWEIAFQWLIERTLDSRQLRCRPNMRGMLVCFATSSKLIQPTDSPMRPSRPSTETRKCQNWKVPESIFMPNWKVSESESVRIGKCQNRKVSELLKIWKCQNSSSLESVRMGKCQKLLGLESVRIGKCQKLLRLESVRSCLDWKVSEIAQIGKCQKLFRMESVRIGKCQKLLRLEIVRNCSDWKVSELEMVRF